MKASAIAWLTKIEMLDAVKRGAKLSQEDTNALTKDKKALYVRDFQDNVTILFDPQTVIPESSYQTENYGLNRDSSDCNRGKDASDPTYFITPETQHILKALNQVPMISHTDTLDYIIKARNG